VDLDPNDTGGDFVAGKSDADPQTWWSIQIRINLPVTEPESASGV
jgi:hypothetical protein